MPIFSLYEDIAGHGNPTNAKIVSKTEYQNFLSFQGKVFSCQTFYKL